MKTLSTLFLLSLSVAACSKSSAAPKPSDHVSIEVTEKGFTPENVTVPGNVPVTMTFTRKTNKTCATEIVMMVGDQKIEKALPLNEPVEVAATFPKAGKVTYACGMDMIHGTVTVQ